MAMMLGRDGKMIALGASLGKSVPLVGSSLYFGLLQSAPSDMDTLSLASLIHSSNGNEFSISSDFYTGRKEITFGDVEFGAGFALVSNSSLFLEWENTSGSSVTVNGMFVTNVSSGSSGQVLWCGTPDVGTSVIPSGESALIEFDSIDLKVD